jgi:hypothetical protein
MANNKNSGESTVPAALALLISLSVRGCVRSSYQPPRYEYRPSNSMQQLHQRQRYNTPSFSFD